MEVAWATPAADRPGRAKRSSTKLPLRLPLLEGEGAVAAEGATAAVDRANEEAKKEAAGEGGRGRRKVGVVAAVAVAVAKGQPKAMGGEEEGPGGGAGATRGSGEGGGSGRRDNVETEMAVTGLSENQTSASWTVITMGAESRNGLTSSEESI